MFSASAFRLHLARGRYDLGFRFLHASSRTVRDVIAYRIEPRRAEPARDVVAMRAPRSRVIVLGRDGVILAADPAADRALEPLGSRTAGRLPHVLDREVARWLRDGEPADLVITPLPGMLVRVMDLDGPGRPLAVLVEHVTTRENLRTAARTFGLSPRELDVVRLLLEGDSASEIAGRLCIAEYTVGDYIKRIFAKTCVRNRAEMIAKVLGWRPEFDAARAPLEIHS